MSSDGPLQEIREHEEEVRKLGKRNDRAGAMARYLLDLAHGEVPDDRDAATARLPQVDGEGDGPSHELRDAPAPSSTENDATRPDTQYCPGCGEEVIDTEDQYCRYCGTELSR
jgi:hypothetical protein